MDLKWTSEAHKDLQCLYEFLITSPKALRSPKDAAKIIRNLVDAPARILTHPRIGEKLEEFQPREVRRLLIKNYEMMYEIQASTLFVLRIGHRREDR